MATERIQVENELRERIAPPDAVAAAINRRYNAGFVTEIETESLPPGLSEDVVRAISARKGEPEWMTEWRLKAYRHWLTMTPPHWAKLSIDPIGAIMTGMRIGLPRKVVVQSTLETFLSTRGRKASESMASRLRRSVVSV